MQSGYKIVNDGVSSLLPKEILVNNFENTNTVVSFSIYGEEDRVFFAHENYTVAIFTNIQLAKPKQ